jgi:L-threonylcarbamoyladenylate synthase
MNETGAGGTRHTEVLAAHDPVADAPAIGRSAVLLRAGELVAFPTETVYGLGADATNARAVRAIFAAKGRPHSDPLIVHLADATWLERAVRDTPTIALALAQRFWPGPLTLVLPRAPGIPALVAAGGDTVGVRVPAHPIAQALLRAADVPVAAPSANRFMHTSPTTAEHVLADLDGRIACVLDGGPTSVGVESTVVDLTVHPPRLLRPGGVTLEVLRDLLPDLQAPATKQHDERADERPEPAEPAHAPGQLERHYAPATPLVVFDGDGPAAAAALLAEARAALVRGERVAALVPDEEAATLVAAGVQVVPLGPSADLAAIARELYAALRIADALHADLLLAHTFGPAGLGLALCDRLRRAAGGQLRAVR